jgi:hypothetical protein
MLAAIYCELELAETTFGPIVILTAVNVLVRELNIAQGESLAMPRLGSTAMKPKPPAAAAVDVEKVPLANV